MSEPVEVKRCYTLPVTSQNGHMRIALLEVPVPITQADIDLMHRCLDLIGASWVGGEPSVEAAGKAAEGEATR